MSTTGRLTIGPVEHSARAEVQRRRPPTVRRWNLLARLARIGPEARLVLLVAPPGYGKTTLLQQWAEVDDRHVRWLQLGDADDDPATLAGRIAADGDDEVDAAAVASTLAALRQGRTPEAAADLARAL